MSAPFWPEREQMTSDDDPFGLRDKVVLITGGSRGLGRAMAMGFARSGADLIITSRNVASCEDAAAEARALGARVLVHACHVGRWSELPGLVDAAYDTFGRLDVLVNNAGMSPLAPSSAEVSEELFDKVVGVNMKGPFRLCALAGERMKHSERGGSIINVSSMASIRPNPEYTPYAAAKAGLNALTIAFARELAPTVRVNAIIAGPFLTDVARAWPEERRRTSHNALGRPGQPEEIVQTALYLAGAGSSFTTGALIPVDGGIP
jgi:NAD(P)-dependent dehydrogenase (short-subunit alcohol dehydrogenase family)